MIDFMANIKNKKNMTMCNIKTLMATSVLCVFFNGILIYGMEDNDNDTNNNNKNESNFKIEVLQNDDDTQKKRKNS